MHKKLKKLHLLENPKKKSCINKQNLSLDIDIDIDWRALPAASASDFELLKSDQLKTRLA